MTDNERLADRVERFLLGDPTCGAFSPEEWRRFVTALRSVPAQGMVVVKDAVTDTQMLDWLEENHTLHQSVEILYVVDGYQVTLLHEDGVTELSPRFEGHDLRSAINEALLSAESSKEGK